MSEEETNNPYNIPKATRESIAQEALDVVKQYSDILADSLVTEDNLHQSMKDLIKFYFTKDKPETWKPYPYQEKNQEIYEDYIAVITSATDTVEPVISDMKERMFRLERNQPDYKDNNFSMQMQQTAPPPPQIQMAGTEEKKPSFMERHFTGVKKKKIVNKTDPYQLALELIKNTEKVIDDTHLTIQWHNTATEFEEDEFDFAGYRSFLSMHRNIWRSNVEPQLYRIYSSGLKLILNKEKEFASAVLSSTLKEMSQDRMFDNMQK